MAQRWRKASDRQKTDPKPLTASALETLALSYVGRFATSRGKLAAYLRRKLRERGWEGDGEPPVDAITERMAELRYVDDAAYATMKSDAMQRRGLGARRIAQTLTMDGIEEELRAEASPDEAERWASADRLARRKHIGPYGEAPVERAMREKQIATFLRAGHDMKIARMWVDAAPGEMPEDPEAS